MSNLEEKSPDEITFDEAAAFLSRYGWLSDLSRTSREAILDACRLTRFPAETSVYHMGDKADGLYGFVHSGLRILLPVEDGDTVMVHMAERGFWVGDAAFFAKKARLVSLVTSQPTAALHINQARMRDLLEEKPDLSLDFFALSQRNLATALRLLANLTIPRSDRRIAFRLLHYDSTSGSTGDWMKLSQDDLTRLVAVSLPTVQRTLRKFSQEGAVELGYGRLRIRDREKLIALFGNA